MVKLIQRKTITFTDNGIGMTADEVKEQNNQIAFSEQQSLLSNIRTRPTRIDNSH